MCLKFIACGAAALLTAVTLPADPYLTPQEAVKKMTVPAGFSVDLIAAEPEIVQPVAFCWDARGRIWVVEGMTYPSRRGRNPDPRPDNAPDLYKPTPEQRRDIFGGEDRILIFEDSDGNGSFETRKVFIEKLNLVSGIEIGFGGVFVGAAPYLMYIPLDEKTDEPVGDPDILCDGFGWQDTHETLNSFVWGPDGWLYGCHGVFTHSNVRVCTPAGGADGKPRKRTPLNCGYWRFHPVNHVFEVYAHGTSNPWGLDYNDNGDWFSEACVIPHFWHIIQGGYYLRQSNPLGHFNPHVYTNIETIADHLHYTGETPHAGNGKSDSAGGGHAHCGLCIYNGENFPSEYRGRPMFFNIHGQRINQENLVPEGSGYVAKHLPDFLLTNDANFSGVALRVGPDGAVYFIDWYDRQKCHQTRVEMWDRSNGRIYRVKYDSTWKPWRGNIREWTVAEAAKAARSDNGWSRRMASLILQERAADKTQRDSVIQAVSAAEAGPEITELLQFLLRTRIGNDPRNLAAFLEKQPKSDAVTAKAVQAIADAAGMISPFTPVRDQLTALAVKTDPTVRLALASALQRLPEEDRWPIAEALVGHEEDKDDHNLPQMYWYAIEPLVATNPDRILELSGKCRIPIVSQNIARRLAATDNGVTHLVAAMAKEKTAAGMLYLLNAARDGMRGRTGTPAPAGWESAWKNIDDVLARRPDAKENSAAVLDLREALAVAFGDKRAFPALRKTALDTALTPERRQNALQTLISGSDPELGSVLLKLLDDPALRLTALRAIPSVPEAK